MISKDLIIVVGDMILGI